MRTDVELLFLQDRIERWIAFGRWADERVIDRRRRIVSFEPGALFALVRWQAGAYGTALSRIDVIRAVRSGEAFTQVPYVAPGGELLLHVNGWEKVQQVLRAADSVIQAGVRPHESAPDYWRHVGNRLAAGLAPRSYDARRHCAWRMRVEIAA